MRRTEDVDNANDIFQNRRRERLVYEADRRAREEERKSERERSRQRDAEREKRAEAAEARAMRGSGDKGEVAREVYFEGASRRVVRLTPRIPRMSPAEEEVLQNLSRCSLEDRHWGAAESTAAEHELDSYLLQVEDTRKPTAAISPRPTKEPQAAGPVEPPPDEPPVEPPLDESPVEPDSGPCPPEWDIQPPPAERRSRSRTRRQREAEKLPSVVIGPPGLPAWELQGARASAPGEGKHRKKSKSREPNPRRQLTVDDYEPFHLRDEDTSSLNLAIALPPPPRSRPAQGNPFLPRSQSREAAGATAPEHAWTSSGSRDRLWNGRLGPKPSATHRSSSILRKGPSTRSTDSGGSTRMISWGEPPKTTLTGAQPRDQSAVQRRGARLVAPCARERDRPLPFGQFFRNMRDVPYNHQDPPPNACHNCWSKYHHRANCPKKPQRYCKNCGRWDVWVEDCPRCCEGWALYREQERRRQQRRKNLKREKEQTEGRARSQSRARRPAERESSKSRQRSPAARGSNRRRSPSASSERAASAESQRSTASGDSTASAADLRAIRAAQALLDRIAHLTPEAQSALVIKTYGARNRNRSRTRGESDDNEYARRYI